MSRTDSKEKLSTTASCCSSLRSWLRAFSLLLSLAILSPCTIMYAFKRFYSDIYWQAEIVFDKPDSCGDRVDESAPVKTFSWKVPPRNIMERNVSTNRKSVTSAHYSENGDRLSGLQRCVSHPACMKKWVSKSQGRIEEHFKGLGFLLHPKTSIPISNMSGSSHILRKGQVSVGSGDHLLQYLHHIPHFSEAYFNFFSISVWSCDFANHLAGADNSRIFFLGGHDVLSYPVPPSKGNATAAFGAVIIDKLVIHETSRQFWNLRLDSFSHRWIKEVVDVVNAALGIRTIRSSACSVLNVPTISENNEEQVPVDGYLSLPSLVQGWYLHSSDALLLGSLILQEDPCKYKGSSKRQLQLEKNITENTFQNEKNQKHEQNKKSLRGDIEPRHLKGRLKVGILNRPKDRKLLNSRDVVNSDLVKKKAMIVSQFILDDKSLVEQVSLIRNLDVLIAVHGAGLTNIAWLKPCSVLLEVFPNGYYIPGYFGPLAAKIGLIHHPWEASSVDTYMTILSRERPHCLKKIHELREKVSRNNIELTRKRMSNDSTGSLLSYSEICFDDDLCRSCARGADGIRINLPYLEGKLSELLAERAKCVLEHDFL